MQDAVLEYLEAGLSVIPTHPVLKNPRIDSWTVFQKNQPTPEQVKKWFGNGHDYSPGIITGAVSGNLELLDFDENARQFQTWKELVQEQCPGLVELLVQQTTQNGGIHIAYRCPDVQIPGNRKLSTGAVPVDGPGEHQHGNKAYKAIQYRGKWVITPTLIETRGNGGYFLASPGRGYQLVSGSFSNIPCITPKEREILHECAEILSEYEKESSPVTPQHHRGNTTGRPGDDFNARVPIQELLRSDGWRDSGRTKSMPDGVICELWVRPGKDRGVSATVYDNKVHVFTSNATPLEERVTYDPFSYYATVHHFGNWAAAASDLAQKGYGCKQESAGVSRISNGKQCGAERSNNQHESAGGFTGDSESHIQSPWTDKKEEGYFPVARLVEEFIEQQSGVFSVYDLDREFMFVTRQEKNNRARILNRLASDLRIKKVVGKAGFWKIIDGQIKPMKLSRQAVKPLEITLPLGLSDYAQILPGNIVLIAGAPNAGKTAFFLRLLNSIITTKRKNIKTARTVPEKPLNGNQKAVSMKDENPEITIETLINNGIRYLNSEMDEMELTDRLSVFDNGIEEFSNGCEFIQRYRDFADVILPDGINFIDFLEIHEDFFELGKLINEIFGNLKTGICFIACQKKQGADHAKGGSASLEKPRLAINLDRNEGYGKICKIVKCKKTTVPGENHDGKEIDYEIDGKSNFLRYSVLRYVNEQQRKRYNADYQRDIERNGKIEPIPEKRYEFMFRLVNGKQKGVLGDQVERWQDEFSHINVRTELERIQEASRNKPFLDDGWFYALPNILSKARNATTVRT